MDKKYKALIGIGLAVAILVVGVPIFIQYSNYINGLRPGGSGNFEVICSIYLKGSHGSNILNTQNADLWKGSEWQENQACGATGLLTFGARYKVGDVVTIQVRDDLPSALTQATDFYMGPATDFVVPLSGEAGDTVSLGIIYIGDIANTGPTLFMYDSNGTRVTTGQDVERTTISYLEAKLSGGLAVGESWGTGTEVKDLITGKSWVGGLLDLTSTVSQSTVLNAKWYAYDGTLHHYIFQIEGGTFWDDPNIDTDGAASFFITIDGSLAATTSTSGTGLDAVDQCRLDQLEVGTVGQGISTVTAIAFGCVT
jgi:hypothetical protein